MSRNNAEFEAGHGKPEVKYQYHFGHQTQHQMGAYARIPTDLGNGSTFPIRTRIGELSWSKKTGIAKITVHPQYRRMGIGTELWNAATKIANERGYVAPSAKASTTRTDAGDAFLKKVDPNAGDRKHTAESDFGDYY